MSAPPQAIRMDGIDKYFGAIVANRGATLEVAPGEIHALVGENGAGKSTLMRVLGGLMKPDAGRVEVNGRDVTGWSTSDAIAAGIGIVHQHFMLVPTLTVAENLVLGSEPTKNGVLNYARAAESVKSLSAETGLVVEPTRKIADLSVGEAQKVEILKVLFRGAKILVLDEPTAVLSPPEVRELWTVLRRLRDKGDTIVLITHRLDEVVDLSDTITVMRAGKTVARIKTSETTPAEIARAMVGREVALSAGKRVGAATASNVGGRPNRGLEVQDLAIIGSRGTRVVDSLSFSVRPGEILGIAGVEGNGQTELIEGLAGLRPIAGGRILIDAVDITARPVSARHDEGLSHIPEDRHRRGLILEYSVADNLILGVQDRFTKHTVIDSEAVQANAAEQISSFDIRPTNSGLPARTLSGGNQQKVVIAREMSRGFSVLLASQPTRGVDVGAIEFIHQRLIEARAAGKAILLVSAELNEVLALSDRIAVMYRGKFPVVMPASEASEDVLGEYMIGAKKGNAA